MTVNEILEHATASANWMFGMALGRLLYGIVMVFALGDSDKESN